MSQCYLGAGGIIIQEVSTQEIVKKVIFKFLYMDTKTFFFLTLK